MRHLTLLVVTAGDMLAGAGLGLAFHESNGRYLLLFGAGLFVSALSWGYYRMRWNPNPDAPAPT